MDRRVFFAVAAPGLAGIAAWFYHAWFPSESDALPRDPGPVSIAEFGDSGEAHGVRTLSKVLKSDRQWRESLTYPAFQVTRKAATEFPYSGPYWNLHERGLYRCVCCGTALFSSDTKFDSGTG